MDVDPTPTVNEPDNPPVLSIVQVGLLRTSCLRGGSFGETESVHAPKSPVQPVPEIVTGVPPGTAWPLRGGEPLVGLNMTVPAAA